MEQLGDDFVLLSRDWAGEVPPGLRVVQLGQVAADRLGLGEGGACLIRPDHYVAARWKNPDAARIEAALARAKGGQTWHS